jgi:hypothetical protein
MQHLTIIHALMLRSMHLAPAARNNMPAAEENADDNLPCKRNPNDRLYIKDL